MHNNAALPVETLDAIVQELISALPEGTEDDSFLPRRQRHLAPLLRVSKLWHAVTERQMYRVISIGKTFFSATASDQARRAEIAYGVTKKLLGTLRAHPRLAAYVEVLELATRMGEDPGQEIEWTRINIHIIQACLNVKYVDNFGNYGSYQNNVLEMLMTVLREKSLVSFCFRTYSSLRYHLIPLNLHDILPCWPNLQAFNIYGCLLSDVPSGIGGPFLSGCCPHLHEITMVDCQLCGHHYDMLRSITDRVTKLNISPIVTSSRDRDALYKCIYTWSTTLTHLRIRVGVPHGWEVKDKDHNSLWAVVSTLTELRELQIYAEVAYTDPPLVLRLDFIVRLSQLERLCIVPRWDLKWPDIDSKALETANLFLPALRHIVCWEGQFRSGFGDNIHRVCRKRNIKLEKWHEFWWYSKTPGFVL